MWNGFTENYFDRKRDENVSSLNEDLNSIKKRYNSTSRTAKPEQKKELVIKTSDRSVFTEEQLIDKIKEELLKELKGKYDFVPKGQGKFKVFSTVDIFKKYEKQICKKAGIECTPKNMIVISNAIRKTVNLHFGIADARNIKDLDEQQKFSEELERFIKDYILTEEK